MILAVLIVAVPLGIVWGTTRNAFVVAVGSAIVVSGWLLLVALGTDSSLTAGFLLAVAFVGLVALAVGIGLGWAIARLTRGLFDRSPES